MIDAVAYSNAPPTLSPREPVTPLCYSPVPARTGVSIAGIAVNHAKVRVCVYNARDYTDNGCSDFQAFSASAESRKDDQSGPGSADTDQTKSGESKNAFCVSSCMTPFCDVEYGLEKGVAARGEGGGGVTS